MTEQQILVVDDEPANVRVLEDLLDLHMPRLDGFEVMRRLRERPDADAEVPILVLTADVTLASRRAALRGGAKDFVTKPFDHVEVLARVANLLDTRSLHMQLRRHNERLEASVRMRDGRGTHFDARLLDLFLGSLDAVLDAFGSLQRGSARNATSLPPWPLWRSSTLAVPPKSST